MEFSLKSNLPSHAKNNGQPLEGNATDERNTNILRLLRAPGSTPKVEENPLRSILADFRSDLSIFVNTEEIRTPSIGFALRRPNASASLDRLKAACGNVVHRLEDVSLGTEFHPSDKMVATQVQEQIELFNSFLHAGIEERDMQVEQIAIKMKSMITQVIHQMDGGSNETQVGEIEHLLNIARQNAAGSPLEISSGEEEDLDLDDE